MTLGIHILPSKAITPFLSLSPFAIPFRPLRTAITLCTPVCVVFLFVIGMESENRCASSSSSSLALAEIEAVETLAAMRESGSVSGDKWRKKGRRDRKRFARDSNSSVSVSTCQDLSQGQAVGGQNQHEKISTKPSRIQQDFNLKQAKVEHDVEYLPKSSTACTSNCLVECSKSRRNLTEEEKEARRIPRVLANRESARQTIRRRQALCEELTRKAANLALENEILKREKELALKEYRSLETTNKNLKAQIADSITTEVEKTPVELGSSVADITVHRPVTVHGSYVTIFKLPILAFN